MKRAFLGKISIILAIIFFVSLPTFAASDNLNGPITHTSNVTYTNDTVINFNSTLLQTPNSTMHDDTETALSAKGNGVLVKADDGISISIKVTDDNAYTLSNRIFKGIEALTGATIDFSNNEVYIFTPGKGLYVNNNGKILVGANAKIYAYGLRSGNAVYALGGTIEIGDGARLIGNAFNEGTGVVAAYWDSKVTIGDNAYILSTSLENQDLGQSTPQTANGNHIAVNASYGAEITIGDDSKIIVEGMTAEIANDAIVAGARNSNEFIEKIYGTVIIGKNATIETNGRYGSYAIRVRTKNSYVEVGSGAKITSSGSDNAGGIFVEYGGEAKIGDDSIIKTTGTSSYALYSTFSNSSPYILPETRLSTPTITTGDRVKMETSGNNAFVVTAWNKHNNDTYTDQGVRVYLGDYNEITSSGKESHGIYANGKDTIVTAKEHLKITTTGETAHGLYLTWSSSTRGPGEVIIGKNSQITTWGSSSYGIGAWNGAIVKIDDNAQITTNGSSGRGVFASSANINTPTITIGANSKITTKGESAYALYIWDNGNISLSSNTEVLTTGDYSYGIILVKQSSAGDNASITFGAGSSVTTKGIESHAVYFLNDSDATLNISNVSITTEGENSDIFFIDTFNLKDTSTTAFERTYSNLDASSLKGNLITGALRNGEDITFTFSDSTLRGDILSTGYKEFTTRWENYSTENINIILEGSTTWEGSRAVTSYLEEDTTATDFSWLGTSNNVNLKLRDASSWLISKDSHITSLNMSDDTTSVKFLYDQVEDIYHTASIDNLSGSGEIHMNVDLSSTGQGNLLLVDKASGEYSLIINAVKLGNASKIKLISVTDISLNPEFELSTGETFKLGAYNYFLDNATNSNEWVLTRKGLDPGVIESSRKLVLGLFETSKAVDAAISDTLINNKKDVWVTVYYKKQSFKEDSIDLSMKQSIWGTTIGMDLFKMRNIDLGMFLGLNVAYQEIEEDLLVDTSNFTLGAYFNYAKNGLLLSGYFRGNNYSQNLKLTTENKSLNGSFNSTGYNISIQALKKIHFSKYEKAYIAPKLKASYSYISKIEKDFIDFQLESLEAKSLVTWVGVKAAIENKEKELPYEIYVEAAWVHDTNPSVSVIIGEEKEITLKKNRLEIGAGAELITSSDSEFALEFKYVIGHDMTAPINIKMDGSFKF